MLAHDCLLLASGHCVQAPGAGSAHPARDCANQVRDRRTSGVDRAMLDQQHHRRGQHAAWRKRGDIRSVSVLSASQDPRSVDYQQVADQQIASTGMHIIAATFLLPVGVVLYTFVGGIKATFLTDYFHTFVITVIVCFFTIKVFMVPEIGSPQDLFDIVASLGRANPVPGNYEGSYLTMTSKGVSSFILLLHVAVVVVENWNKGGAQVQLTTCYPPARPSSSASSIFCQTLVS